MPIQNPSFEDPGVSPGAALGWTLVVRATAEAIAAYGPAPGSAAERFERGWAGNDGFAFAFEHLTHVRAAFTAAGGTVEGFEAAWSGNEGFLVGLTDGANAVPAAYDGHAHEAFEAGWRANQSYSYALDPAAVTPAPYATTGPAAPHEDFDSRWRSNEAFATSFAQLVVEPAAYQAGGTLAPREAFEVGFSTLPMTTL